MRHHPLLSRALLILICICFSFSFTTAVETMGDKFKLLPVNKTLFVNKKIDIVLEFFPKTKEAKLYSGQREPLDLEKSAPYIKPNLKQPFASKTITAI